jgi:hypothetical protein
VGKVTLKSNDDEVLSEYLFSVKSNGDEASNEMMIIFLKSKAMKRFIAVKH